MHEVLFNRLGGLSLPRKSVVRLTDRPDMTLDVYRGRKTTMQQQQQQCKMLDAEETLKCRSQAYNNLMRSKCLYCTLAFLVVLSQYTVYFFYFHSLR